MKNFILIIFCVGFIKATFVEFNFLGGFKLWELKRKKFLKTLKGAQKCLTDKNADEIMQIINASKCSPSGLPLEDAIRLEYDQWLSEDWFPNEDELEAMKLDEVMM